MDLYIHVSTSPVLNLNVRIHLQHIPTQEQSNTVKCLHPGSDILGCLEEHIYNEVLDLKCPNNGHSSRSRHLKLEFKYH